MLQSWLAGFIVRWIFAGLRRGDIERAMLLDADDVVLTFPGESSFAGVFRGKQAHREWEQRFVNAGIQIVADEVVAMGPPWRTRLCVRGRDWVDTDAGERVYENRVVLWATLSWGRMKAIEVYEDTEKATRFDRWLSTGRSGVA